MLKVRVDVFLYFVLFRVWMLICWKNVCVCVLNIILFVKLGYVGDLIVNIFCIIE